MLVWKALEKWIAAYVRLYYESDASVSNDVELQGFVAELGAENGGRLQHIGPILTVSRLIDLMARIVFRASAFHATINYSLYDYTYAPNGPTSAFGPGATGDDKESDLMRMLPPWNIAYEVIQIYWALQLRLNRLGVYDKSFTDDRLEPALEAFRAALSDIDARIDNRNASRPWPYVYSKPELITESIHV
jgi:arachidonate 15-lipoxygenase